MRKIIVRLSKQQCRIRAKW